jgi:hypothetical protein
VLSGLSMFAIMSWRAKRRIMWSPRFEESVQ